jgi:phosphate:Na+ symporter
MTIILGVGMLLGGLFSMRLGLKHLLWKRLQHILQQMTLTPWRGMLVGTLASALMQSSTALSLITISLVGADYLSFYQGLGIILGANIGTCSTVQLMALFQIPQHYFLPLFLVALTVTLMHKRLRYIAMTIAGLLSMFIGLNLLTDALGRLSMFDTMINYLLIAKQNPYYGILGGAMITLLFQSSSAATGLLMVLADKGIVDLTTAAYVVYGNNIGSCLSSVIIGAAAPIAAKRVAVSHIMLNILGVAAAYPLTGPLIAAVTYFTADFAGQVALLHTIFNIISSLVVLPIVKQYAQLIMLLVPGKS